MLEDPGYNFSFSGLKTSVLYYLRKHQTPVTSNPSLADICASFQEAVVDVLVGKLVRAAIDQEVSYRQRLGRGLDQQPVPREADRGMQATGVATASCAGGLCTDNAAMIAALAYHKLQDGEPNQLALEIAPSIGLGVETA